MASSVKDALLQAIETGKEKLEVLSARISSANQASSNDYETWGPKDLLAHSAEWMEARIAALRGQEIQDARSEDESFDEYNRRLFERNAAATWESVMQRLESGFVALEEETQKLDDQALRAEDPGSGQPVWRGIAFYGIVHVYGHAALALVRAGASDGVVQMQQAINEKLIAIDDSAAWQGIISFALARALVLSGDDPAARQEVRTAIKMYPDVAQWVARDPDFAPIADMV